MDDEADLFDAYDTCPGALELARKKNIEDGGDGNLKDVMGKSDVYINTKWSMVYKFNGVIYTFLCVQSIALMVGVKYYKVRAAVMAIHSSCTCILHFALIITTAACRFSTYGTLCA